MRRRALLYGGIGAWLAGLAACTINPVTGERQLTLVTADDEVAIGNQQYLPSQQMQGGEYRRDPALTSYVRSVGRRLAAVSDRDLPYEFVIVDSSVPNAWALPGGKIAVNRGLLVELGSEAELAAVLGHEIVHAAARHGAIAMQRGLLLQGAVTIAAAATRKRDYSNLAVGAASLGAELINMRNSRENELEADAYGMRYMSRAGYDPEAAVSLQQTFVRLANGGDNGWLTGLFASHPPSRERVLANQATAASLPGGGELGREAYMSATAELRRAEPGFEALDAARGALADGELATARREAAAARNVVPNEAQVEALDGDIALAAGQAREALDHYARAVAFNGQYFYNHLVKADAHLALDELGEAAAEYDASIALLPTARAYLGLGRVAEARGDVALALENYGRAADAEGQTGADARAASERLDLPRHPANYLTVTKGIDVYGRPYVDVANPTGFEVGGIVLSIAYSQDGQARILRRELDGTLAAGGRRRFSPALAPVTSTAEFIVTLEAANIVAAP